MSNDLPQPSVAIECLTCSACKRRGCWTPDLGADDNPIVWDEPDSPHKYMGFTCKCGHQIEVRVNGT